MVGDFNGDGRDDLIGRVATNGDWWIANSTGGSFANERWGRWSANVAWMDVTVGNLNGNGPSDLFGRVARNGDWWAARSNGSNGFVNERVGCWPAASVSLASTSSTGAVLSAPPSTAPPLPTSLSDAPFAVFADLLVPDTSTGLPQAGFLQADEPWACPTVPPPGGMPALPGSEAMEKIELIDAVLRDMANPSAGRQAEHRLLQALFAGRADLLPECRTNADADDDGLPGWEALIDDLSFDARRNLEGEFGTSNVRR